MNTKQPASIRSQTKILFHHTRSHHWHITQLATNRRKHIARLHSSDWHIVVKQGCHYTLHSLRLYSQSAEYMKMHQTFLAVDTNSITILHTHTLLPYCCSGFMVAAVMPICDFYHSFYFRMRDRWPFISSARYLWRCYPSHYGGNCFLNPPTAALQCL
jgi:hypothetical protein